MENESIGFEILSLTLGERKSRLRWMGGELRRRRHLHDMCINPLRIHSRQVCRVFKPWVYNNFRYIGVSQCAWWMDGSRHNQVDQPKCGACEIVIKFLNRFTTHSPAAMVTPKWIRSQTSSWFTFSSTTVAAVLKASLHPFRCISEQPGERRNYISKWENEEDSQK